MSSIVASTSVEGGSPVTDSDEHIKTMRMRLQAMENEASQMRKELQKFENEPGKILENSPRGLEVIFEDTFLELFRLGPNLVFELAVLACLGVLLHLLAGTKFQKPEKAPPSSYGRFVAQPPTCSRTLPTTSAQALQPRRSLASPPQSQKYRLSEDSTLCNAKVAHAAAACEGLLAAMAPPPPGLAPPSRGLSAAPCLTSLRPSWAPNIMPSDSLPAASQNSLGTQQGSKPPWRMSTKAVEGEETENPSQLPSGVADAKLGSTLAQLERPPEAQGGHDETEQEPSQQPAQAQADVPQQVGEMQADEAQADETHADEAQAETAQADKTKTDETQAEETQAEETQADETQADTAQADTAHANEGQDEKKQADEEAQTDEALHGEPHETECSGTEEAHRKVVLVAPSATDDTHLAISSAAKLSRGAARVGKTQGVSNASAVEDDDDFLLEQAAQHGGPWAATRRAFWQLLVSAGLSKAAETVDAHAAFDEGRGRRKRGRKQQARQAPQKQAVHEANAPSHRGWQWPWSTSATIFYSLMLLAVLFGRLQLGAPGDNHRGRFAALSSDVQQKLPQKKVLEERLATLRLERSKLGRQRALAELDAFGREAEKVLTMVSEGKERNTLESHWQDSSALRVALLDVSDAEFPQVEASYTQVSSHWFSLLSKLKEKADAACAAEPASSFPLPVNAI